MRAKHSAGGVEFTETEWKVVQLAPFNTSRQVGDAVSLSQGYVEQILHSLYGRMGISGKAAIAPWFIDHGGKFPPHSADLGDVRFRVGDFSLDATILAGDGEMNLSQERLTVRMASDMLSLPRDLSAVKKELADRAYAEAAKYSVLRHRTPRPTTLVRNFDHTYDNHELVFEVQKGSFDDYVGLNLGLDVPILGADRGPRQSIREKYLSQTPPIIPRLPIGVPLCTSLVFVLQDGDSGEGAKAIVGNRLGRLIQDRNMYGGAGSGFVDYEADMDPALGAPNPFRAAVREALEETGIELKQEMIQYRGVALDLRYYFVDIFGEVLLNSDVARSLSRPVRTPEHVREAIDFTPKAISQHIREHPWQPTPALALMFAAGARFGWNRVIEAFSR